MRQLRFVAALLSLCAFGLLASVASASNGAHFMNDTSASVDSNSALVVFIDEAGVGNNDVNYSISWTASAVYGCFNGGGNHPKAANKTTINATGSADVTLSPINGRIQQSVTVAGTPPGPGSFTCPSGQTLRLISVSYNPVTVTDETNNVSISLKT